MKSPVKAKRSRLSPAARREHLLGAAIAVFAEEGIAATSILRITQAAGVSNATFYHYFENREDLLGTVAATVVAELTRGLLTVQTDVGYPERIAVGAVWTVTRAVADPTPGALLAELLAINDPALKRTSANLVSDIVSGTRAGVFTTGATPLLVKMFTAMFAVAIREGLAGRDAAEVGEFTAAAQLRMLGVPNSKALKCAARARALVDQHAGVVAR